jgi:hypothetical protein
VSRLPDDVPDRALGSLHVVNAEPNSVRRITVQVLLFAMLIDAHHAAPEDELKHYGVVKTKVGEKDHPQISGGGGGDEW